MSDQQPPRQSYGAFDEFMRSLGRGLRVVFEAIWRRYLALRWRWRIAVAFAAVVGLLALIGAAAGEPEEDVPVAAAQAEETVAPTRTPPPENTPTPTKEAPAATPTANLETVYRALVYVLATTQGEQFGEMGNLLGTGDVSAGNRAKIVAHADKMLTTARQLRDLSIPSSKYETFQRQMKATMEAEIEALTLLKSGVTNLNVPTINDAAAAMNRVPGLIQKATAALPAE